MGQFNKMRRILLYLFLLCFAALLLSGCGGKPAASEAGVTDTGSVPAAITASASPDPSAEPSRTMSPVTPSSFITDEPSSDIPTSESGGKKTAGQPPLLSRLADSMGLSFEDMTFGQVILAAADGSDAKIYCYDKNSDGIWSLRYSFDGHLGQNGVTEDKREGDKCTPAGLFRLGFAFGNSPKPETELEYRPVTENVYWVDDPSSVFYNQWVEGTERQDWSSAEHLSEYPKSYAYALVIEYNYYPDTVAGAGSAIFLHCGSKSGHGCICVGEDDMLEILRWLSPQEDPHILIANR
ncbi:L,D-peptidoglycan transpeptidase YkuD, ErfK/YbiS/YcfS/YnhG family [Papillibacter cinnamivorans DSM 12816]|uniref:L,D-peptidoglycan transpeptidase YkuD, ErfK/YbiS/YcfS/YnhG family n=2 Tax=Papillibacter TaxID=100175 RepID=A0A1W2CCW5_9FIRM|nr:L,D-peptidoglycan transpeptidase YkuD, ErfK/YbiS/YcfS/YnhG family [Papillibacter cinnamivorans DSM 12816]